MKSSLLTAFILFILSILTFGAEEKNLCPNPSFTEFNGKNPVGWTAVKGAEMEPAGRNGSPCLQIVRGESDSPEQAWISDWIPVDTNRKQLNISGWFKTCCVALDGMSSNSDPSYNASLSLLCYDENRKELISLSLISDCHTSVNSWHFRSNQQVLYPATKYVRLKFHFMRSAVGMAWLDDITLSYSDNQSGQKEAGTAPLYSGVDATNLLPYYLDGGKCAQIFDPGETISFAVKYRHVLRKQKSLFPEGSRLQYQVYDYNNQLIESGEQTLRLDATDRLTLKCSGKIKMGRYYECKTRIVDSANRLQAEDVVSFGTLAWRKIDPAEPPEMFELPAMPGEPRMDLALRLGVRRIYIIGTRPSDKALKIAAELKKKYGLYFMANHPHIFHTCKTSADQNYTLPNVFMRQGEDVFRKQLEQELQRYKGIIDCIGVLGELMAPKANEKFAEKNAEHQVEYLRVVKDVARKVDPNMKVAAGGYFNTDFELLIQKGMMKHADVLQIHRFADPFASEADFTQIEKHFANAKQPVPELWVDEAYCEDTERNIVKHHVVYKAHGVTSGDWHTFYMTPSWKRVSTSNWYPERSYSSMPQKAMFTYYAMLDRLSGLKFLRKFNFAGGRGLGYLFRKKNGGYTFAAWTRPDVKAFPLFIKTGAAEKDFQVWDMWGGRINLQPCGDKYCAVLSAYPQFFEFSGDKFQVVPVKTTAETISQKTDLVAGMGNAIDFTPAKFISFPADAELYPVLPEGWSFRNKDGKLYITPAENYRCNEIYPCQLQVRDKNGILYTQMVEFRLIPQFSMDVSLQWKGSKPDIAVTVFNSGKTLSAELQLESELTAGLQPDHFSQSVKIEGNGKQTTFLFPVTSGNQPDLQNVKATLRDSKGDILLARTKTLCAYRITKASAPHVPTGKINAPDWKNVEPVTMASRVWLLTSERSTTPAFFYKPEQNGGTWKTSDDFNVKFYQQWDDNALYMRFVVHDPQHINPHVDETIWSGDALQIKILSDAFPHLPVGFCIALNKDKQMQVWRYKGNEYCAHGNAPEVQRSIVRHEDQKITVYDLVFPKKSFLPHALKTSGLYMTAIVLNRINTVGDDPMAMRFGSGIYGPAGIDIPVHLVEGDK